MTGTPDTIRASVLAAVVVLSFAASGVTATDATASTGATPRGTGTPPSTAVSGFGTLVAVLALASGALLVGRRD